MCAPLHRRESHCRRRTPPRAPFVFVVTAAVPRRTASTRAERATGSQWALSSSCEPEFCQTCDHAHTTGDDSVRELEKLFTTCQEDIAVRLKQSPIKTTVESRPCIATHIRHGLASLKFTDGATPRRRRLPWSECDLQHADVNLLLISESLAMLEDRHQQYLKHLYLDRNQT